MFQGVWLLGLATGYELLSVKTIHSLDKLLLEAINVSSHINQVSLLSAPSYLAFPQYLSSARASTRRGPVSLARCRGMLAARSARAPWLLPLPLACVRLYWHTASDDGRVDSRRGTVCSCPCSTSGTSESRCQLSQW